MDDVFIQKATSNCRDVSYPCTCVCENLLDANKFVAHCTIIDTAGLSTTSNGWVMYK